MAAVGGADDHLLGVFLVGGAEAHVEVALVGLAEHVTHEPDVAGRLQQRDERDVGTAAVPPEGLVEVTREEAAMRRVVDRGKRQHRGSRQEGSN